MTSHFSPDEFSLPKVETFWYCPQDWLEFMSSLDQKTGGAPKQSTFSFEKPLHSYEVSKDLLKTLQDCVLLQLPSLTAIPEDMLKGRLRLLISDNFGTETRISANDFNAPLFPNSTYDVQFKVEVPQRASHNGLQLRMRFHSERKHCAIAINFTGPDAREVSIGIYEKIKRSLEPFETKHWMYHYPKSAEWFYHMGALVLFIVAAVSFKENSLIALLSITALGGFVIYRFIANNLRPFTVFETRLQQQKSHWADWAEKGLAGFVVFGTALTFFRKHFFGF